MKKLGIMLLLAAFGATAEDQREFNVTVDADGLDRLELSARVGTVKITGADTDEIKVQAILKPSDDWRFGDVSEVLKEAELYQDTRGGALVLELEYDRHHGDDDDDVEEEWEITVPAEFFVDVSLNVGEVDVQGTRGGVDATVNVGELTLDVLAGDIDAEVNVGEVSIMSATQSPGEFDLETNIGGVDLRIGSRRIEAESSFIGSSIRHDAGGDDDISAEVNVGEVDVNIRD